MSYDEDSAIYLWPEYFDAERTRSEGRRVVKRLCVNEPDLDIIAKAAMILDLEYRIFENMSYPSNWASKRGCVRVEKGKIKKAELLQKVAEILVKNQ